MIPNCSSQLIAVQVSVSNNEQRRGKRDRKSLKMETVEVFVVLDLFDFSIVSKLHAKEYKMTGKLL